MEMLSIDPVHPDKVILSKAAEIIRGGGLVAFPTETVYGIGADATNPSAVKKIYEAKGRDTSKPILVLISHKEDLVRLVRYIPERVEKLMDAFWPGPLTIIFPALEILPTELLGRGKTIGVRHSSASVPMALCSSVDSPITAPSANCSGGREPLTAEDVAGQLGDWVDLILDGGDSPSDVPSTVVDVSNGPPRLIRGGCTSFDHVADIWHGTSEPAKSG